MARATVRFWPALAKTMIRPEIYGHFAGHAGRCVYEGIWVGENATLPNQDGIRLDVLAALKQLRAPVVRWPGGCFADDYHWRDGVGPRSARPGTVNIWGRQGEPNEFGTDEYLRLCRALGAQPYICVNVGSGSPAEARQWLEYCNFGGESALARQRAQNGGPEPYGVKYWGIGNENWGGGGRCTGAEYAREFRRFGGYLKGLDPTVQLVACGAGENNNPQLAQWNHDLCAHVQPLGADLMDHLSSHRFFSRGAGAGFSDGDYRDLFGDIDAMARDLERTDALLRYYFPGKAVGIIFDEWGMWHPEATVDNGLEQAHTLRDALMAGSVLNLFNRWAHRVAMANIAQTINVLQCMAMTRGDRLFLTPTYHAFDLMRSHMGARLVTQEVDGPSWPAHPGGGAVVREVAALDVSASLSGRKLQVTVINRALDQDIETRIHLREARPASLSAKILSAASPQAANTFETPSAVTPRRVKIEGLDGDGITHVFPRHSMTALAITLE